MTCKCGHPASSHVTVNDAPSAVCMDCPCSGYAEDEAPSAPAEPSAPLREATPAEDELITDLSRAVGHRLLRAWEDLPSERRALPMNRAFLSALALSIGNFLGATAVNDPENLEGWNVLVAQTLEIIKQTAADKRQVALEDPPATGDVITREPRRRVLIPEPKAVM